MTAVALTMNPRRRLPSRTTVVLAAIGLTLLVVVGLERWGTPQDEHSYWLAARRLIDGAPLYDLTVTNVTPYAYRYPPILAQVLVPVAAFMPPVLFGALWTAAMLGALLWLANRNVLIALAMIAFPPVAIEFWFRNVHLFLAVIVVLGLRHYSGWFAVGAAIKLAPGIGIPYLALRGRRREALVAVALGVGILAASIVLSPAAWSQYAQFLLARGVFDESSFIPVPYLYRAVAAIALVLAAARLERRHGDILFVVAFVVALPSLWVTALSALAAIVPVYRLRNLERLH